MDEAQRRTDRRPWYETLAQVLTLIAVLLPINGAVARFLAFQFTGTDFPLDLPVRAPIGQLTVTGLNALVLAAPFLALYALAWFGSRELAVHGPDFQHDPVARRALVRPLLRWSLILLPVVVIGAFFLPDWPLPYMLGFLFAGSIALERENALGRRVTFSRLWGRVVYVTLGASVIAGVDPAKYQFSSDVQAVAPNGYYLNVGSQDSVEYLVSCKSKNKVIAIPAAEIVTVQYPPANDTFVQLGPSAWDMATGKAPLRIGLDRLC